MSKTSHLLSPKSNDFALVFTACIDRPRWMKTVDWRVFGWERLSYSAGEVIYICYIHQTGAVI